LHPRPEWIVVDLGRVRLEEESLSVLSLMRRCSERHGVRLALAAVDADGRRMLEEWGIAGSRSLGWGGC
jgi:hypothetical protein